MADNFSDGVDSGNNNVDPVQSPMVNCQNNVDSAQRGENLGENAENRESNSRERTQTDHLNNILLRSFLEKLNQPNSGFPQTIKFDTDENNEEDGFSN